MLAGVSAMLNFHHKESYVCLVGHIREIRVNVCPKYILTGPVMHLRDKG